jgi:UDP-N-acetylmuramoyl-tripeptide--D-alanyl-D-alanine ligase
MKKFAKSIVVAILGWQVRRLRKTSNFKVVAVAGSIGKTSTKFAIANVLKQKYSVRFQEGNYNDLVTVPLIFFGHPEPSLFNPFAWLKIFLANEKQLKTPYRYDVVVVEVGTDGPGQLARFKKYLQVDIGVVTAISPEHMEYFADLDAVAKEELTLTDYSKKLVVNADLSDEKYLAELKVLSYGAKHGDYRLAQQNFGVSEATFKLMRHNSAWLSLKLDAVSLSELYSASAAAIVAEQLGMPDDQITKAIEQLQPVSGRMQRLSGIKDSLILDETYNASPVAMKGALDSLYSMSAPQKIAILGNMNELGEYSESAHREIGEYCQSGQLDLVVTIGPDANKYLAPAAKQQGCKVYAFINPYEAGEFVKQNLREKAVILAKGSQNGVFAEEAIKQLLAHPIDQKKLVRQSTDWIKKKEKAFKHG